MKLIPISDREDAPKILYDLLAERTPEQSISHAEMPTWEEHIDFVERHNPRSEIGAYGFEFYEEWYLIEEEGTIVGSIYLTQADEIGISVFRAFRRRGFGTKAVGLLLQQHPKEAFFANVNP